MTQPATPAEPVKPRRRGGWIVRNVLPFLVLAIVAGIWQRERLWVWYCVNRLESASAESRGPWGERLANAGDRAMPALVDLLKHDDPSVCNTARQALETMSTTWSHGDGRGAAFAKRFVETEPRFSTPGRAAGLELLPLVVELGGPEVAAGAQQAIAQAAKSDSVDVRVQAIAVALHPRLNHVGAVAHLIADASADVRKVAILALGPARDAEGKPVLTDDDLLRCLHDADSEVKRLSELNLRSRGRSARDIRLGRRYTSADASERQKLLLDLADEEDLDVAVWLDRLTSDADPAVRAGAARVAFLRNADLRTRIEQLSQSDPDPTVRRIANFYRQKMADSR